MRPYVSDEGIERLRAFYRVHSKRALYYTGKTFEDMLDELLKEVGF